MVRSLGFQRIDSVGDKTKASRGVEIALRLLALGRCLWAMRPCQNIADKRELVGG